MSTPRPGSLRARPIAAATLAGGLVVALALAGALDGLERSEYDLLFRIRGARPPAAPIVIAAIDEASLKALGGRPLPRATHGRAIDRLHEAGAAVIAIDILFPEPSVRGEEDDRLLGEAVARAGNVVIAALIIQTSEGQCTKLDVNPPVAAIGARAAAVAPVNAVIEADGVVRRMPLSVALFDERLLHFVVSVPGIASRAGLAADGHLAMPGVEVHANALENLLTGASIRVLPRPVALAVLLLVAAATGVMVAWTHDRAFLVTGAAIAALAVADIAFFSALRWWPRSGLVILALAVAGLAAVVADATGRHRTAGED